MKANLDLIKIFSDTDKSVLRKYSYWLYLKGIHVNSRIYRYNDTILSNKSGITRQVVMSYVKFFIEQGWCKVENGNLLFISNNDLINMYNGNKYSSVEIKAGVSPKQILNDLRYELLKEKNRQFNVVKKTNENLKNPKNSMAYKSAKRFAKRNRIKENPDGFNNGFRITLKKMSDITRVSSSTVRRLIKEKEKEGLAKIHQGKIHMLAGRFSSSAASSLPAQWYIYKNRIMFRDANSYEFL